MRKSFYVFIVIFCLFTVGLIHSVKANSGHNDSIDNVEQVAIDADIFMAETSDSSQMCLHEHNKIEKIEEPVTIAPKKPVKNRKWRRGRADYERMHNRHYNFMREKDEKIYL